VQLSRFAGQAVVKSHHTLNPYFYRMAILVEILGWLGSVMIVGAYFFNIRGKLAASSPVYIWCNCVGGLFFTLNTFYHQAYPSMIVNIIWVFIAIAALLKKKPDAS